MENLIHRLRAAEADPIELNALLSGYFGRSRQPDDRCLIFFRDESETALTLRHNKAGVLTSIEAGVDLRRDDLHQIKAAIAGNLLQNSGFQVCRAPLFSSVPTLGRLRVGDRFQILPVPANAPPRRWGFGDLPFLLEVGFPRSADRSINVDRGHRAIRRVELILALLLWPMPLPLPKSTQLHWVIDFDEEPFRTKQAQRGYIYEGFEPFSDAFSDTTAYGDIPVMPENAYYSRLGVGADDVQSVPDSFNLSLDLISSLGPRDEDRFFRAAYWFKQSHELWTTSLSISFTCLVSAIEALLDETDRPRCEACNAEMGPGPTAKFHDFLEAFGRAPLVTSKMRKIFYNIRSELTHGSRLLFSDEMGFGWHVKGNNDQNLHRELSVVVQIAMLNWLRHPDRNSSQ